MEHFRRLADKLLAEYHLAGRQLTHDKKSLKEASRLFRRTEKAQKIVQAVAQAVQQQAHDKIAQVVTKCLEAVFGEEAYEFRIVFERKRGKTEARLAFFRDGLELDPIDGVGIGVVDLASLALRLACLVLKRPKRRRLLVLDEPFRHLSRNYQRHAATLIKTLAEEFDVQFIMVTHSEELAIGKVIRI
jgi:DNA repair exonuclease SbcCD ATPase subunit